LDLASRAKIYRIALGGGAVVIRREPSVVVVMNKIADFIFHDWVSNLRLRDEAL
jgi:hypothetical protein